VELGGLAEEEAVGQGAADALVKEDEDQGGAAFIGQAVGFSTFLRLEVLRTRKRGLPRSAGCPTAWRRFPSVVSGCSCFGNKIIGQATGGNQSSLRERRGKKAGKKP